MTTLNRAQRRRQQHAETVEELPLLLTVRQAAQQMGVSETHAWWLVRQNKLASVRLSARVVRVPRAALEHLAAAGLEENEEG